MTLYAEGEGRVGEPCDENDTLQLIDGIPRLWLEVDLEVQHWAVSSVPYPCQSSLASLNINTTCYGTAKGGFLFFLYEEMKFNQ